MAIYTYTVVLTVSPAGGQGPVPEAVEAEKVADFVKRVSNLGDEFGIGKSTVEVTLET